MTRTELVDKISKSVDLTKAETTQVIKAYETIVGKALSKGEDVALIGFGRFSVVNRAARNGHHPRSGKKIKIPAKKAVKFKVGKRLASVVN
ncbi:MAG TPA: HU family DNA-binding protein [Desulfocapsa sulfexigens]|nr:HU family DNA-binding protein [Desulfocapsa sulfexigens]